MSLNAPRLDKIFFVCEENCLYECVALVRRGEGVKVHIKLYGCTEKPSQAILKRIGGIIPKGKSGKMILLNLRQHFGSTKLCHESRIIFSIRNLCDIMPIGEENHLA